MRTGEVIQCMEMGSPVQENGGAKGEAKRCEAGTSKREGGGEEKSFSLL